MMYGLLLAMALIFFSPAVAETAASDQKAPESFQLALNSGSLLNDQAIAGHIPVPDQNPAAKSRTPFYKTRVAFYSMAGLCVVSGVSALVFMKLGNDKYDVYKKAGKGADFKGMRSYMDDTVLYNNISFGVWVSSGVLSALLWKIKE